MKDSKKFSCAQTAQSILIDLVLRYVNLPVSSESKNPDPSNQTHPESAIDPNLGLKVADLLVAREFEVWVYVRKSKSGTSLNKGFREFKEAQF